MLSADELLAGSQLTFLIEIPTAILSPSAQADPGMGAQQENANKQGNQAGNQVGNQARDQSTGDTDAANSVRLRPLTLSDLQTIARAAKESDSLVATLMVQRSLVEPETSVAQVAAMHAGLVRYLLEQVNQISGISTSQEDLSSAIEEPLSKASFVLAREFGWTPQEVNDLTLGQILLHLQMLQNQTAAT